MKLIHVADIHVGATSDALLEAARRSIIEQKGAALVVSGDLTQRGTREEFRGAREWVNTLQMNSIVVPGNHDTPLLHAGHRLFKPFGRYADYFGDLTRSLRVEDVHLFPLNTARGWQTRTNWAEGSVDLGDLDEMITEAGDHDTLPVMICHHPFTPLHGAGLRTRTRRGDVASERLAKSRFEILLTGHVHTPHAEWIAKPQGRYLSISAGTLSLRLRKSPPGYNVIEVSKTEITVTPFSYEGDEFRPLAEQSFSLSGDEA